MPALPEEGAREAVAPFPCRKGVERQKVPSSSICILCDKYICMKVRMQSQRSEMIGLHSFTWKSTFSIMIQSTILCPKSKSLSIES